VTREQIEIGTSGGETIVFERFAQARFEIAGDLYWLEGDGGGIFTTHRVRTTPDGCVRSHHPRTASISLSKLASSDPSCSSPSVALVQRRSDYRNDYRAPDSREPKIWDSWGLRRTHAERAGPARSLCKSGLVDPDEPEHEGLMRNALELAPSFVRLTRTAFAPTKNRLIRSLFERAASLLLQGEVMNRGLSLMANRYRPVLSAFVVLPPIEAGAASQAGDAHAEPELERAAARGVSLAT
jgi:hypothetical protein